MSDREEKEEHESFATVQFSRCQGDPGRLFGSSLRTHQSFIVLRVSRCTRIHSLGRDTYYSSMNGDLVEVALSAAQFAELLTTMNVGSGVPCTLRRYNRKGIAPPPDAELEVEKVRTGFQKDMGELTDACHADVKEVEALLEKKSLTKEDRARILGKLKRVMMEVESNVPFMLSQFEEATEKVVQHAKAEMDAFATNRIFAEGLRAIGERAEAEPPKLAAAEEG